MIDKGFKKWLSDNPWFGKGNKVKTQEFMGIAISIRNKTTVKGMPFLRTVEEIWESSDIKTYPK